MNLLKRSFYGIALLTIGVACTALVCKAVDQTRPAMTEPKVIDPGLPGGPPSDAIVLFSGTDLSSGSGQTAALQNGR
jgi:hypothetical protein